MKKEMVLAAFSLLLAGCVSGFNIPPLTRPSDYKIYEPYGLSYDPEKEELYYNGRTVRYFTDSVELSDGWAVRCEYLNEKGTVDIHTTWIPVDNGDGSYDPFGELTGIEEYSQKEFEERDLSSIGGSTEISCVAGEQDLPFIDGSAETACVAQGNAGDGSGRTFSDIFSKYREFGIEYVESQSSSGRGNVYYNGTLVNAFSDISRDGTFSFHSSEKGTINVQAVYDENGNLTGVEQIQR